MAPAGSAATGLVTIVAVAGASDKSMSLDGHSSDSLDEAFVLLAAPLLYSQTLANNSSLRFKLLIARYKYLLLGLQLKQWPSHRHSQWRPHC